MTLSNTQTQFNQEEQDLIRQLSELSETIIMLPSNFFSKKETGEKRERTIHEQLFGFSADAPLTKNQIDTNNINPIIVSHLGKSYHANSISKVATEVNAYLERHNSSMSIQDVLSALALENGISL